MDTKREKGNASQAVLITLLAVVCLALVALAYIMIARPSFAKPLIDLIDPPSQAVSEADSQGPSFSDVGDATPTQSQEAAEQAIWDQAHKYPLIANCGDVYLNSCISPADLTGVLFHQASYNYAYVLDTQLPEADYEKTVAARAVRVNHEQSEGEWLDADALHIWRTTDTTPMDTSIDIGAEAGTVARAPVSGTVVLVKDYMLYDEVPDVRIHIQPDGRKDLDCVMIHTTDPMVKAGDHVEGGITEVCKVRDIEKDLTDVQLSFFTPDGVSGNHVHVQLNDVNYPGYRKERLAGAIKVK